jgi:ribonucleotide monophosphatase NagD (HAD superfamily)
MLVARDTGLNYDRLNHALNLLLRGARVYAANPDLYHPAENGRVNLETGLLLAVLKAARPNSEVHLIGKPSPMLIEKALRDAGMGAAEALFIGDNPLTDGGAAAAADVPMALIGPSPGAVAGDLNQLLHLEGL